MFRVENPVLQRELLVFLRMKRAFLLLFGYVVVIAGMVFLAWPEGQTVTLSDTTQARRLFDLFTIGQFVLVSLLVPTFAAGSIAGEKERLTYELLLSSPLPPGAILMGKLLSSLCYLAILIFATLPLVMICLPLGGVNFYELLAANLLLLLSAASFGMICLACSTYFRRTASALVVSYLLILPLAISGVAFWQMTATGEGAQFRLFMSLFVAPCACILLWGSIYTLLRNRLLYPPDLGSEGKEVVDEDEELKTAVGMVIQRDQFPDSLFAPSRRTFLLDDKANPVFDKEMRSEIFSGGTLMARLVIQVSMFLAIPLMGVFLFFQPHLAPFYVGYVLVFNMLVGPVFLAGSVTSERERQTLDLLLTTNLSPSQILWPKWLAGLRVSTVLTLFLTPPIVLAGLMISDFYPNFLALLWYFGIILMTCVTTATVALFCSVVFRRTSVSMVVSYLALLTLFVLPPAIWFFVTTVGSEGGGGLAKIGLTQAHIETLLSASPFAAAYCVPLDIHEHPPALPGNTVYLYYFAFYVGLNGVLLALMMWLFRERWRVAQ